MSEDAGWRRESKIAEVAFRVTGAFGGGVLGALACALSSSARSRLLLLVLVLIGGALGTWLAGLIELRLPAHAGGKGLNALSPTWQGVLFLGVGGLLLVLLLGVFPAYPRTFTQPWLKFWLWFAAGLAILLGCASLLYRVDFRWFGLFSAADLRDPRFLADAIVIVPLLVLAPPIGLPLLYVWAERTSEETEASHGAEQEELRAYGKGVFLILIGLALASGLLWIGLAKMRLR